MSKGASGKPDRATHEPSQQAVSAVPVGIPSAGDLRVWWIPQVPMKAFEVDVPDLQTAALLLAVLADYDAFQFENNVKPDYCNTGGLNEFDADVADWFDWEDRETGDSFDEVRREPERLAQAIEARRAETGTGSVADESAVPQGCAQTPEQSA